MLQAEVVHKAAALAWVERHEAAAAAAGGGEGEASRTQALFRAPRTQKFVAWIRAYESGSESEEEEEESSSEEEEEEEED